MVFLPLTAHKAQREELCVLRGGSVLWRGALGGGSHTEGWAHCTGNIPHGSSALGITALSLGALLELKTPRVWNTQNTDQSSSWIKQQLSRVWDNLGIQCSVRGCCGTFNLLEVNDRPAQLPESWGCLRDGLQITEKWP